MSVYVVEEGEDIAPVAYQTFDQAKAYIISRAGEKGWELINDYDAPEPDFKEDNANRYGPRRARPAERPVGKTFIWGRGDEGEVHIIIHKLTLKDDTEDPAGPDGGRRGGRRKTAKTIRMNKKEYLREHHHLFRVLRNPTRRALNAELRAQQKELRERGLRG
jgi:hypothetical protein